MLVGTRGEPIDFATNLGPIVGSCRQYLDDPGHVAADLWIRDNDGRIVSDLIPPDATSLPSMSTFERLNYTFGTSPPRNRTTVLGRVPDPAQFRERRFSA